MPIVIEIDGSSTVISGSGRGFSGSESVSPMVMSGMPAVATMSPGLADSAGLRSSASVISSSDSLTLRIVPSARHHATVWPRRSSPATMRQSARRPR
jgi:hypothetical protein